MIEYEQLHLYTPVTSDESLEAVFEQALRSLVKKEPRPKIEAHFYPYAGLSSTIRLRQGRVLVRVSDILVGSPHEVLLALASILVAKLYRLKASKVHEKLYRAHTLHPPILDASQAARRNRGYKITTSSRGKIYDLAELFAQLNAKYFDGELESPMLSWSQRQTRRILGHHDHVHRTIIISRTLDDAAIPRYVVEYVLYHEMLHVKHPARLVSGRTIYHGAWFRDDERRFERFDEALKWLEKIAVPSRRKTRRRPKRPCN
jgi:hypothetical protein